MALPSADVIHDLEDLIVAITGFEEGTENFAACKKFSLSNFVHLNYPSVNKNTMQAEIDSLQSRFYTQGKFEVAKEFRKQVDKFLSFKDVFQNNPQVEIEWVLLSLVTSLASNLSSVDNVPELLPVEDEDLPPEDFDWAAFLSIKTEFPQINYDCDSSTCSSFSSDSDSWHSPASQIVSQNTASTVDTPEISEYQFMPYKDPCREKKFVASHIVCDKSVWVEKDIETFGNFTKTWSESLKTNGEIVNDSGDVISLREALRKCIHSLMTGSPLTLKHQKLSFLLEDSLNGFANLLQPCVSSVRSMSDFILATYSSPIAPITSRAYASILKRNILLSEIILSEVDSSGIGLLEFLEEIRPVSLYLKSLASVHNKAVSSKPDEPNWCKALRILVFLQDAIIHSTSIQMQAIFVAMFLHCMSAYANTVDVLLSSSSTIDTFQEFVITREMIISDDELPSCTYTVQPYREFLAKLGVCQVPFLDGIVNKIQNVTTSLSVVCILNRFIDQSTSKIDSPTLYETIMESFRSTIVEKLSTDDNCDEVENRAFDAMIELLIDDKQILRDNPKSYLNLFKFCRNNNYSGLLTPIHKKIENVMLDAVKLRVDAVQKLAKTILVDECGITRHLTMLRNVLLCNNASLLIPFTQVLFHSETSWDCPDYLTSLLRDCVAADFPDLSPNLSIEMSDLDGPVTPNILQIIDCITVLYQVEFPVSLVITPTAMLKYNEIFKILLKLKWAYTTISRLPFPDKSCILYAEKRIVFHRLQLLRFSCLSNLNLINNYFIAQVSLGYDCQYRNHEDVQNLIMEHERILDRIHCGCLMPYKDKCAIVISQIVVPLCLELARNWNVVGPDTVKSLKEMEFAQKTSQKQLQFSLQDLELNSSFGVYNGTTGNVFSQSKTSKASY